MRIILVVVVDDDAGLGSRTGVRSECGCSLADGSTALEVTRETPPSASSATAWWDGRAVALKGLLFLS